MKKLKSIFTSDMDHCVFTGSPYIERHHVFGGYNRARSEKYGFIAPLRYDLHPNGIKADPEHKKEIDAYLKQQCQEYYENNIGTRDEFIEEFGRNYL